MLSAPTQPNSAGPWRACLFLGRRGQLEMAPFAVPQLRDLLVCEASSERVSDQHDEPSPCHLSAHSHLDSSCKATALPYSRGLASFCLAAIIGSAWLKQSEGGHATRLLMIFHILLLSYLILYYIVLYCIVLYCIVLYCIVLYCIVLYYIILY